MAEIRVMDVTWEEARDLAWFCVPPDKRDDLTFRQGVEAKEAWIAEKLGEGMPFAKLAYVGPELAGMIQYEPIPEESVVRIHCIFVPQKRHWKKGVGTALLQALVAEMKEPQPWNDGQPASALTTRTFPGHGPEQLPAREFFRRRGFHVVGDDPDFLFFPLQPGAGYRRKRVPPAYVPQREDEGHALILHGPSFCPWGYPFNLMAAQVIAEIAPGIPIRWVDRATEPVEWGKRGGYEGVVVNARPIQAFVLEREAFAREVREALTE